MSRAENPFDRQLEVVIEDMARMAADIEQQSEGVPPFDSVGLNDDEEAFAFANPAALLPGETDEQTGAPLTNAQAAALLLQRMGPAKYVQWVEKHYRRAAREGSATP